MIKRGTDDATLPSSPILQSSGRPLHYTSTCYSTSTLCEVKFRTFSPTCFYYGWFSPCFPRNNLTAAVVYSSRFTYTYVHEYVFKLCLLYVPFVRLFCFFFYFFLCRVSYSHYSARSLLVSLFVLVMYHRADARLSFRLMWSLLSRNNARLWKINDVCRASYTCLHDWHT